MNHFILASDCGFRQLDPGQAQNTFMFSFYRRFESNGVKQAKQIDIEIKCGFRSYQTVILSDGSEFHVGWIQAYPGWRSWISRTFLTDGYNGYYGVYPSRILPGVSFGYSDRVFDGNMKYAGCHMRINLLFDLQWVEVGSTANSTWYCERYSATEDEPQPAWVSRPRK